MALRDLRGHPVVLIFYITDWRPVCSEQLALYQTFLPELARFEATLLAVSVGSVWRHGAFARAHGLTFPLLADIAPTGAVARAYGAYHVWDEADGRAVRGRCDWHRVVEPARPSCRLIPSRLIPLDPSQGRHAGNCILRSG